VIKVDEQRDLFVKQTESKHDMLHDCMRMEEMLPAELARERFAIWQQNCIRVPLKSNNKSSKSFCHPSNRSTSAFMLPLAFISLQNLSVSSHSSHAEGRQNKTLPLKPVRLRLLFFAALLLVRTQKHASLI
jgi:hypothetical protein